MTSCNTRVRVAACILLLLGIPFLLTTLVDWQARCNAIERVSRALDQLRYRLPEGPSRGAPAIAILGNELTDEIIAEGPVAIPTLVERFEDCNANANEVAFVVYCLSKLKAANARPVVERLNYDLRRRRRFEERSDLTLDFQIVLFLRDCEKW
jgi:hypothetical protein